MFLVPKAEKQKWKATIPGLRKLKTTSVIYEKHFEKK